MATELATTPAPAEPPDSELPEGWVLTTIGEACGLNPPKPPPDALPADALVTFVPMPAVDADSGAIAVPELRPYAKVRSGYTAFRDDDVIMAKITPCMENGKAAIARGLSNGLGFGSTEFHVLRPNGVALAEYLYYYIRQESFRTAAEAEMTGSVGQRRVPADFLNAVPIPIPPLAEQRRIVAAVELLIARNTLAADRLRKMPALLKRFRQAVLAAACSGRLTADWREARESSSTESPGFEESPELPDRWEWREAGDYYCEAGYGTSVKCDRESAGGFPVIRIPNIASGSLDLTDLKYAHVPEHQLATLFLQEGDIVVCRTNGSLDLIGKAAVVLSLPQRYSFASYLIRLRLDPERLLPEYLHICLSGPLGRDHIEKRARTTAGQYNLNLGILREFAIPVPPLAEQREIVRRVEALMGLAAAIERRVAAAQARADTLTQAILAQAFRGALVPTEAELARREGRAYEPAAALLARIRAERGDAQPSRGRRAGQSGPIRARQRRLAF